MAVGLERLLRLLDENDCEASEKGENGYSDKLWEKREFVERQLLSSRIRTDADAVALARHLARTMGDGERSDGLDVRALQSLAVWMESRFAEVGREARSAA